MNVLVVGGTGLIGGEIALHMQSLGHAVTIMARKPPQAPALAALDFLAGDYVNDDLSDGRLAGFDSLVFAAAADIRGLPQDGSVSPEAFYTRHNDEAVPRFFCSGQGRGYWQGGLHRYFLSPGCAPAHWCLPLRKLAPQHRCCSAGTGI